MSGLARSVRRSAARESGQTVIELLVAMSILGLVVGVFLAMLVWVQTALVRENTRTTTVNHARLALEAIDRDVRSGRVLYNPANATPTAYYGLIIATQAVESHIGTDYCVQYRVSSGSLVRRTWATSNPSGTVSAWATIASNIVNSGSSSTSRPFQLDTSASSGYGSLLGSRVVNVMFQVNANNGNAASATVRLQGAMAIRNQVADSSYCTTVPSG
jgi:type II secretory pathway component PulJ